MRFEDFEDLEMERTYSIHHGQIVNEYWKDVPGYSGKFLASTLGRVKINTKNGRELLTTFCLGNGYRGIYLNDDKWRLHHVILTTFEGKCPSDKNLTRHLNDIPVDNCLANLCWGTSKENAADRERNHWKRRWNGIKPTEYVPLVKPIISRELERTIKKENRKGVSPTRLAEKYNLERRVVQDIIRFIQTLYIIED